jgi:hypothetical protein
MISGLLKRLGSTLKSGPDVALAAGGAGAGPSGEGGGSSSRLFRPSRTGGPASNVGFAPCGLLSLESVEFVGAEYAVLAARKGLKLDCFFAPAAAGPGEAGGGPKVSFCSANLPPVSNGAAELEMPASATLLITRAKPVRLTDALTVLVKKKTMMGLGADEEIAKGTLLFSNVLSMLVVRCVGCGERRCKMGLSLSPLSGAMAKEMFDSHPARSSRGMGDEGLPRLP